jgi:hypothetical protein
MQTENSVSSAPLGLVTKTLGAPLEPGSLGAIMGRAGVGKTAFLTHVALEHMVLHGQRVLHVCIDELAEKIKVWYREFLKNIAAHQPGQDMGKLQEQIEPLRFILAYLHQTFSPAKLEQSLLNLREQAKFFPSVVVLDGLDFDRLERSQVEEIQQFALRHAVSVWISARTHRHISITNERGIPYPCHEMDDLFRAILFLEPKPDAIEVKVMKSDDRYDLDDPGVAVNPQTYLILS